MQLVIYGTSLCVATQQLFMQNVMFNDDIFLYYLFKYDATIFKMAAIRHVEYFEICDLCHVAVVNM